MRIPDPIDVEVGAKIRLRRQMKGLSQGRLAEILGVTFQQVQKYEKGANRVSASKLVQIAIFLDMPASDFFPAKPTDCKAKPVAFSDELSRFVESKEGRELNIAFSRITSIKLRRKVTGLIAAIAGQDEQ